MNTLAKAQGLPLSTIILAALGLVVLILLFALLTGRLALFSRGLLECPGGTNACLVPYTGDTPDTTIACDPTITRELPGTYILPGQQGIPPEKIKKCSKCCAPLV